MHAKVDVEAEVGLDKAGAVCYSLNAVIQTYFMRGENGTVFRVGLMRTEPDGYWEFIPRAYLPGNPQVTGLIQLPSSNEVVLRTPKWVLRLK